jgi:hypothetical protein
MVTALIIGGILALIAAAKEDTPSGQTGGYQCQKEVRKQREIHRSMFTKCGMPMY